MAIIEKLDQAFVDRHLQCPEGVARWEAGLGQLGQDLRDQFEEAPLDGRQVAFEVSPHRGLGSALRLRHRLQPQRQAPLRQVGLFEEADQRRCEHTSC